ncbi:hypothetical protein ACFXPS_39515 [Nocardia sp. NPDC059091]
MGNIDGGGSADLGSAALNFADVVTSIMSNITYLLQSWGSA